MTRPKERCLNIAASPEPQPVLFLDDEDILTDQQAKMLEQPGIACSCVSSAREALILIVEKQDIALVVAAVTPEAHPPW